MVEPHSSVRILSTNEDISFIWFHLLFFYALDGGELEKIGPVFDASLLSDECGGHQEHGSFTGAFVGMACSDLNGTAAEATFDYFLYRPVKHVSDRYEI